MLGTGALFAAMRHCRAIAPGDNGECTGNLRDLKAREARPRRSGFRACEPGYIHIDVKYLPHLLGECRPSPARQRMADETSRRDLFVAIDRATRWVFVRVYNSKTAANARRFLRDLERTCPPLGPLLRNALSRCPAAHAQHV